MTRKKTDPAVLETCSGCGNKVDDSVCWCGEGKDSHQWIREHSFVPFGCICGYHDKPILPKVYFVTAIDMRPLHPHSNPKYMEWIRCQYQEETPLVFNPRTWLWLPTYEEAEDFVIHNKTDMAEYGTYKWAVIEGIRPVVVEISPSPQVFFEFVGDPDADGHYEKIEGWPKPVLDYYEKNNLVRMIATIG